MTPTDQDAESTETQRGVFATTHWSVVLAAGHSTSAQAAEALEKLCCAYWQPLYVYARRRGHGREEAQDLTQSFFAQFLEKQSFSLADPTRGRFRMFLLKSMQRFLADDWKRAHRLKRGGNKVEIPWDIHASDDHYAAECAETITPERIYEERWAMALLDQVLGFMREDYARAGKSRLFEALQGFLWGAEGSASYAQIADGLGMTEGAIRVAVHRLREHYRERLRAEVAQTVSDPGEVDDELRHLIRVISQTA
jgi:RNA polymerase sigma-70 factor (ECF subfamily)